ncbi:MAG: FliA/WhiG family RNA polymerase sigma factor [Thermoleophilaceae bacterium]
MAAIRETAGLWRRYAARRDDETRAALMLAYWPLVKEVAVSVRAKLPAHVEEADMISAGLFGLLSAIERFDPADAPRFAAFARTRVRGAIIDDMRAHDWAPRHVRERARELREIESALEQKLHRSATRGELAAALGLTADQVHDRLARNLLAQVAALDAELLAEPPGEPVRLLDMIEDDRADDPVQSLAAEELGNGVVDAILSLPWRERRVLTHHYRRGLTFREIGVSLGVSESRVSQIHTQVMRRLRDEIQVLLGGDAFPLRTVVDAAAAALEELDPVERATALQR